MGAVLVIREFKLRVRKVKIREKENKSVFRKWMMKGKDTS